jgi:hypothetical protein
MTYLFHPNRFRTACVGSIVLLAQWLVCGLAVGQVVHVQVNDATTGKGVVCDIFKYESGKKPFRVRTTSNEGAADLPDAGKASEQYKAASLTYEGDRIDCPLTNPQQWKVYKTKSVSARYALAEFFAEAGDPASAAVIYERVSDLAEAKNPKLAKQAESKTFEEVGKLFSVRPATETTAGKVVPSENLVTRIKQFQNENGIRPTGEVNPKTLEMAHEIAKKSGRDSLIKNPD